MECRVSVFPAPIYHLDRNSQTNDMVAKNSLCRNQIYMLVHIWFQFYMQIHLTAAIAVGTLLKINECFVRYTFGKFQQELKWLLTKIELSTHYLRHPVHIWAQFHSKYHSHRYSNRFQSNSNQICMNIQWCPCV